MTENNASVLFLQQQLFKIDPRFLHKRGETEKEIYLGRHMAATPAGGRTTEARLGYCSGISCGVGILIGARLISLGLSTVGGGDQSLRSYVAWSPLPPPLFGILKYTGEKISKAMRGLAVYSPESMIVCRC